MTITHQEAVQERRTPLNRDRVVEAAIELADRDGIDGLSMRRLGQELGVEAMSLYTHVRDKDDLLDGMVDRVVSAIQIDRSGDDWRSSVRETILGARTVLQDHPWTANLLESRVAAGPATMAYFNDVIRIFREAGFSTSLTHHAMHALGSRVLGFSQELYNDAGEITPEAAAAFAEQIGSTYPYVAEMATASSHDGAIGGCDGDAEFAFALDLILDGLERLRKKSLRRE